MTVSTSNTLEFDRDTSLTMALQLCGVLEAGRDADADDLQMGSRFMNMELQALQAEGVIQRTQERALLTLTAGTASYTLPADVIEVQLGPNDQVGTIVPVSGSETLVTSMTRAEYLDLSDKSANVTGRPTRAYVERQATTTLILWPVPDANCVSLRYTKVRTFFDLDTGSVTPDLARRWSKFLVYATAAHLGRAKSAPMEDIQDLRNEAERMKAVCLEEDQQRGRITFRLRHKGAFWR